MHILVSNGLVQNEIGYLLRSLRDIGVTWNHLRSFAAVGWQLRSAVGRLSTMLGCFSKARQQAFQGGGGFKSTASEMLMAYPVLMHFLYTVIQPMDRLRHEIASYEALGEILLSVRLGKEGMQAHERLKRAGRRHAELFDVAYPDELEKPKDHFLHHLSLQLRRDGMVVDAFVGERKNGTMKRLAEDLMNTTSFEKSLLQRAASAQLDQIQSDSFSGRQVLRPQEDEVLATWAHVESALISTAMLWDGTQLNRGDCIFLDDDVYVARGFAFLDVEFYMFAIECNRVAQAHIEYSSCMH